MRNDFYYFGIEHLCEVSVNEEPLEIQELMDGLQGRRNV